MTAPDPFSLQRFADAQEGVYPQARAELAAGRKRSHWMWFIFPQIAGLGTSPMSQRFAISGLPEARAYLDHPLLGPRLREATELVNLLQGRTVSSIFGYPDDLKFHSSATLFAEAARESSRPEDGVFRTALETYFGGQGNGATLERLRSA